MSEPIKPPVKFLVEELVIYPTADRSKAKNVEVPPQTIRTDAITRAQLVERQKRGLD